MSNHSVLLLYGLPCSGKSMVVKSLSEHAVIAVDEIITTFIPDPSIEDFQRYAGRIIDTVIETLQGLGDRQVVVEMGCLIPREAIGRLEHYMNECGMRFTNVVLTANDDELIRRIEQRNADIEAGDSGSIKVHGPDYLTRFKVRFEKNQPETYVELDTTTMNRCGVTEHIGRIR